MAVFIDATYFIGGLFKVGQTSFQPVKDELDDYIDEYEIEYLQLSLGVDFANLLISNYNSQTRFTPIVNMLKADRSPAAAYVFYHYQRDLIGQATGVGDARSNTENAERTPEVYRMVKAWNEMVKKTFKIYFHITNNASLFPEFNISECDSTLYHKINAFGI